MTSASNSGRSRIARSRDRHGRSLRSLIQKTTPQLVNRRIQEFARIATNAVDYLKSATNGELDQVSFELASLPDKSLKLNSSDLAYSTAPDYSAPLWYLNRSEQRIVIFRIPVELIAKNQSSDEFQRQLLIESVVTRAAAAYLGKPPWEFGLEN